MSGFLVLLLKSIMPSSILSLIDLTILYIFPNRSHRSLSICASAPVMLIYHKWKKINDTEQTANNYRNNVNFILSLCLWPRELCEEPSNLTCYLPRLTSKNILGLRVWFNQKNNVSRFRLS